MSPYYDTETQTLYFSSDGLGGLGGYDVFKISGNGNKWGEPHNVGLPINSGADDIYYSVSPKRDEGFFVSNRKGGNSLKHMTCCDDIYMFKNSDYVKVSLKGKVTDELHPKDPIIDAVIEIYIKDKNNGTKRLVRTTKTDKKGNYETNLEAGQEYYILAKKDDYLVSSSDLSTRDVFLDRELNKSLSLKKKPKAPIHIPNIKYEFNSAKLTEASKVWVDTIVLKLMMENPEIIVEIQSHTDNKGTEEYNEKLSQKRADGVVEHLLKKGIDPIRIRGKGYGESMPVAPNENADGSDNPAGRARNRRTDFKIVGILDTELIDDSGKD